MLHNLFLSASLCFTQSGAMPPGPDPGLPPSAPAVPIAASGPAMLVMPALRVMPSGTAGDVVPVAQYSGSGTPAAAAPAAAANGDSKSDSSGDSKSDAAPKEPPFGLWVNHKPSDGGCFLQRLYKVYYGQFFPDPNAPEEPEPPRRAMPSPWPSPPFPGNEYQGYPLIGVPGGTSTDPIMQAIYDANSPVSNWIKDTRIKFSGWATVEANTSNAKNSNTPTSYWIVPNRPELDQLGFRLERYADTVQTDHIDWGFRSVVLYGIDYRYTTAGGWFSDQLLKHNQLYGWDPTEQYFNVYIPYFLGGTDIRVGRWIACPDIESQYAPDNYLGSHSILFTFDTYTQTGIMVTQKLNEQWELQAAVHAGTDMAPWYPGAILTGAFGVRWVSKDNNNAVYAWLNAINNAEFRHFEEYGQPLGHDNFNYFVATYEHRFSQEIHTKTEAYYMWQRNAEVGGTPSAGPVQPYGGGGGDGVLLPGLSSAYGVLNYTMFGLTKRDYLTFRNEVFRDERGMRTGFAGTYISSTVGLSHQFNDVLMLRPECGYYRNMNQDAFDLGTTRGLWMAGFDLTFRF
jgi:Putative beta-barrel porin-2, OmpL-like. bbp2